MGARDGGAEKGDHEGRPYRSARSNISAPSESLWRGDRYRGFVSSLVKQPPYRVG